MIALTLIPSLRSNSGCSDCVWDSTTGSRVDLIADEPRRFGNVAVRVASQLDGLYGHSSAVRCVNWSGRKALPMPLQCTKPQVLRIFIGVSPSITIIKTEQVSGTANVRMAACGVCVALTLRCNQWMTRYATPARRMNVGTVIVQPEFKTLRPLEETDFDLILVHHGDACRPNYRRIAWIDHL